MRREGLEGANEPSESGNNGGNIINPTSVTSVNDTIRLSNGGTAEYVTFFPNETHGVPVVFAPGIPMNRALREPLPQYIAEGGHKVTLVDHSTKGDPRLVRPEAISRRILEGKNAEFSALVGHSYGSFDVIRALKNLDVCDRVSSVVLLAPAGVRKNSLLRHLISYQLYIRSGKSPEERQSLREWDRLSLRLGSFPQLLQALRDITRVSIIEDLLDIQEENDIPVYILEPDPDTLLSGKSLLEPPYSYYLDAPAVDTLNKRRLKVHMGDHNGVLMDPHRYGKPLMDVLEGISS